MAAILQHPVAQALALALVHFLWQGALIAAVSYALTRALGRTASIRYGIGVVTLAAMIAAPAVTTTMILSSNQPAPFAPAPVAPPHQLMLPARTNDIGPAVATTSATSATPATQATADETRTSLTGSTVVLGVWFVGVLTLSVRLLGGWLITRRLATRAIRPVTPELQALAQRVAGRLALDRIVRMFESSFVAVPVTVGWVKPVVLFPAAALTGLSTSQIEALVAHELAHVSRHDYLVNLLQSAVETLLFYHPAVWWVSKNLRAEREMCCDDLAVGVCDRLVYATALTELAAMTTSPRLAMAATGGSLAHRVRRILAGSDQAQSGAAWLPALVAALAISVVPIVLVQGSQRANPLLDKISNAQQTGVPGGVPSGVVEGVPGGVPNGVPGGIPGGVSRTVPGGIPSSVVSGVPGGVQTVGPERAESAVPAAQEQRPRVVSEQSAADARKAEEIRAKMAEVETALAKLQSQRADIEFARERQDLEAQLAAGMAQLETAKLNLERLRKMVDTGMIDQREYQIAQNDMRVLEQKINGLKGNLESQQSLFRNARAVEEQKVQYEKLLRAMADAQGVEMETKLEYAKKELVDRENKIAEYRKGGKEVPPEMTLDYQALASNYEAMRQQKMLMGFELASRKLEVAAEVMPAGTQARSGDLFVVQIVDEPDLPQTYEVKSDGTIRLPIVGVLRVQGQDARQVRDAIVKWFADHKMTAQVELTLRRPRG